MLATPETVNERKYIAETKTVHLMVQNYKYMTSSSPYIHFKNTIIEQDEFRIFFLRGYK